MPYFHVASALNRASIERHGLDPSRMGAARGIAGSRQPEADGVFLARDRFEVDWFLGFDNGDGPFDVWQVDGVDGDDLHESGSGYSYLPSHIGPAQLTLLIRDRHAARPEPSDNASGAYGSTLTITLQDGTVLADENAREWFRREPR